MTYAELIDEVISRAFPEGYASNLRSNFEKRALSGLIELQRWVPYLKLRQTRLYPFASTLYRQGCTVICKPGGKVRQLSTFSSHTLKDFVIYDPASKEDIDRWTQQRARLGVYPDAIPTSFGSFNASAETDKSFRAERGFYAIDREQIFIIPQIESTERIMVEWSGSKTAYESADVVNFGPLDDAGNPKYQEQVLTALENYLRWQSMGKDERSTSDYALAEKSWRESVAGLQLDTKDDTEPEFPIEDTGILPRTPLPRNPFVTPLGGCEYDPENAFFNNIWLLCTDNGKFYDFGALIISDQVVERVSGDGELGGKNEVTQETLRVDRLNLLANDQQFYKLTPHTVDGEVSHGFDGEHVCASGKHVCDTIAVQYVDVRNPDDGKLYRHSLELQDGVPVVQIELAPLDCDLPCRPEISSSEAGDGTITITWGAAELATSYTIKKGTNPEGPFFEFATGITTTSYTNDAVANGDTSFYVVVSVNPCGESEPSDAVELTPTGAPAFPVAAFTAAPQAGFAPFPVQFTSQSQNVTDYDWDFGDGSAHSSAQNPTHEYTSAGTFTVTLTVSSAQGSDQASADITASVAAPPDISELEVWLKADAQVYADTGGTVPAVDGQAINRWSDADNGVRWVFNIGATTSPKYATNVINGLPVVRCASAQFLAVLANTGFTCPQPITIVALVKFTGSSTGFFLGAGTGPSGNLVPNPTFGIGAIAGSPAARMGGAVVSGGGISANQWHVMRVAINGASTEIYVDGALQASGDIGSSGWDVAGQGIAVGSWGSTGKFNGDIAEIAFYRRVLTQQEVLAIEFYLKNKYALA